LETCEEVDLNNYDETIVNRLSREALDCNYSRVRRDEQSRLIIIVAK
jgi:hypothetical protein